MRRNSKNCRVLRIEPLEGRLLLAWLLPLGTEVTGNLDVQRAVDEFEITVSEPGRLIVRTDAAEGSDLDSFLALYDRPEGSKLIESDDAAADDLGALITQHLLPGTYYLEVSASPFVDEVFGIGGYTLSTDWQPGTPPFTSIDVEADPRAITTGDFNGDGNLDLATANISSGDVSIVLGLGDGTFGKLTPSYDVGKEPGSILAGDFDGDGNLDLVVANRSSNDVSVLLGRGDGSFVALDSADVGTNPRKMAAGDLDGDRILDLVVPNQDDDTISVLFGIGDGTFQPQQTYGTGNSPRSVAIGDLDRDGNADIAVTNRADDQVQVFLGKGGRSRTFMAPKSFGVGDSPFEVVLANFNDDEYLDIATTNDASGSVSILLGEELGGGGQLAFKEHVDYAAGEDSEFMLAGDFNGDGAIDLVTGNEDSRDVSILLNNGNGTFQQESRLLLDHLPDELAAGDFDNDGRLDLAVVSRENSADILLGLGDGTFQWDNPVGRDPEAMVEGDFNGDGLKDLAIANAQSDDVLILFGRGDGSLRPGLRVTVGEVPHAIVAADFNQDGRLDLATANERSDNVSILLGLGNGQFRPAEHIGIGDSPWSLVAGDFDGDSYFDLATANRKSNDVSVLYGTGYSTFEPETRFAVGSFPECIIVTDFNEDGLLDLGTVNRLSHDVSMLLMRQDGELDSAVTADNFPSHVSFDTSIIPGWDRDATAGRERDSLWFSPTSLTTGDFNEDNHLDLAVANDTAHEISVFLGNGDGTYQPEIRFPTLLDPEFIAADDLDGDGHLDLVTANAFSDKISILLGLGNGTFQDEQTYDVGKGPEHLAIGDFNKDSHLDVVVEHEEDVSLLFGSVDEDGVFKLRDVKTLTVGEAPYGIVTGYFGTDDSLDFAVVDSQSESGSVAVFLGNGAETFQDALFYDVGTDPRSLAIGDLNNDGNVDLVTSDLSKHSIWVLWGKDDGTFESAVPVLHDDTISSFSGDHSDSPVVVADFNGDGNLDIVKGNDLDGSISILLGNGNRTFRVEQTFPVGIGPVVLEAGFVNEDLHVDLITGNLHSHDVSILLGNGDGTFPTETRIAGGQEPQPVVQADLNGDGIPDRATTDDNTNDVLIGLGVDEDGEVFVNTKCISMGIRGTPILADLNRDGEPDSIQVSLCGDILVRMARADEPGTFAPYQIVNADRPEQPGRRARDVAMVTTIAGTFLAAVDQKGGSVSLYKIRDNGTFDDPHPVSGLSFPTRIASADLNADGQDDLAVINSADGSISVFLADDRGEFSAASMPIPLGKGPGELALIDAGSPGAAPDGWIDIVVTNVVSGDVSILFNDGRGNFNPQHELRFRASNGLYSMAECAITGLPAVYSRAQTTGIAGGDFNEDGSPDLIVTNRGLNTFSILFGKPGGGFVDPVSFPAGSRPTEIQAADFDQDGHLDVAVLNQGTASISVFLGDGEGHFLAWVSDADAGESPNGLAAEDVDVDGDGDGDGILNLLVGNESGDLLVMLGQGDGTFESFHPIDRGKHVALAVADIDGDGQDDLILANEARDQVLVELADGSEEIKEGLLAPGAVEVADLNEDGYVDIVVANSGGNNVLVYLGSGDNQFEKVRSFDVGTKPVSLTIGDVDDDGRPDLVVANEGSNDVSILLGDPQSLLRGGVRLHLGNAPVAAQIGDFDEDGFVDLLVTNRDDDNIYLLAGLGSGFFDDRNPTVFRTGQSPGKLFVGQFDTKPGLDVATLNFHSDSVTLYSDFTFLAQNAALQETYLVDLASATTIFSGGIGPVDAVFSHVNLDGRPDLFVAHQSGSVSLLHGTPDGFSAAESVVSFSARLTEMAVLRSDSQSDRVDFVLAAEDSSVPIRFDYPIHGTNVGDVVVTNFCGGGGRSTEDTINDGITDPRRWKRGTRLEPEGDGQELASGSGEELTEFVTFGGGRADPDSPPDSQDRPSWEQVLNRIRKLIEKLRQVGGGVTRRITGPGPGGEELIPTKPLPNVVLETVVEVFAGTWDSVWKLAAGQPQPIMLDVVDQVLTRWEPWPEGLADTLAASIFRASLAARADCRDNAAASMIFEMGRLAVERWQDYLVVEDDAPDRRGNASSWAAMGAASVGTGAIGTHLIYRAWRNGRDELAPRKVTPLYHSRKQNGRPPK